MDLNPPPESVHAAAVQMEVDYLQFDRNVKAAVAALRDAADAGAQLIVLPELVNLGYPRTSSQADQHEYHAAARSAAGLLPDAMSAFARERNVVVVAGHAEPHPRLQGVLDNRVSSFLPDGSTVSSAKTHLPLRERYYFRAGSELAPVETPLGLIGNLVCADNSFPETARVLALEGADVITVSYMAPALPNPGLYPSLCVARAFENQCFVVASQACGVQGDLTLTARSCIAAPDGVLIAACEPDTPGTCHAVLERSALLSARLEIPRFPHRRPGLYGPIAQD